MTDDSRLHGGPVVTPAKGDAPDPTRIPDRPIVRSPVYVLRAIVGLVIVLFGAVLLIVFEQALLGFRDDIADIEASWPEWLSVAIGLAVGIPSVIAIVGVNLYLPFRRKWRRWIMVNAAAIGSILLGALISGFILSNSAERLRDATDLGPGDSRNIALTSIVAVLTVGSVWIGPRLRPWAVGLVIAAAAASFLPGTASVVTLPLDVGIGILAGALTALILGTRDRTPTADEVAASLRASAVPVTSMERASVDARGSVPWFGTTADGHEIFVKTLNTDNRASDLLFRLYRTLRLRNAGDRRPASSLRRSVEHEAFLSLAAESKGIRTPHLLAVSEIGSDGMLLAYERLPGRSMDGAPPDEVTDDLLRATWELVVSMRASAIAHRDLRLANVFIDADGQPWIIDFGFAELAADDSLLARDVAELLASTATVVGPDRAVGAALEALGADAISDALPWIQPLALSSATRTKVGKSKGFEALRASAAAAVGTEEIEYEKIERVKPGSILVLASVAVALYVLIPQLADASGLLDEVSTANWGWAAVAVLFSALTYLGAGLGMVGAVPMRLPLLPMTAAQLASSFSNRITPAKVGGMATNARFLQKQDIPLAVAVSAVGLNTVAGIVVHVSLLVAFGVIASQAVEVPLPDARTTAIIVGILILLSGVVMLLPIGRKLVTKYLVPALRGGMSAIVKIAKTPTKLIALFGGSLLITASYSAAMLASLAAFDVDVPIASAIVVYLAGSAVANAAPTPGGIGAVEAALIAGYTALGVPSAAAFAAVMLFRLVTFWLPILPGWISLIQLQRSGRL